MNERIKQLRKEVLCLSQKDFAEKLNLSENFVWMIEKGNRIPSERTISDICRIFGIQEDWLRHGIGAMRVPKSEEEETFEMVSSILNGSPDFKRAVVKMICYRTPDELKVLEKAFMDVLEGIKKE